jgi:hypothetical protein
MATDKERATDGPSLPALAVGEPMTAVLSAAEARMPMYRGEPFLPLPSARETGACGRLPQSK